MKQTAKQYRLRKAVVLAAACAMVIGSASIAYAADVGGIQRTVQLWLHGEQTAVTIEFDGAGGYNMEYTDEEGNVRYGGGVGVAIEADGTERPLSEEELLGTLSGPDVEYRDDGSVWVYWLGQAVALALVEAEYKEPGAPLLVDIRGRKVEAELVKTPFYKRG